MRLRRSRWTAGLLAAVAVAGCSRAVPRPAGGTPTRPAAAPTATRAAACRPAQLKIAIVRSGAATGHVGATIGFTNTGGTPCTLTGWPRVVAVTAAGRRAAAGQVLMTFFGPPNLTAPPVVTIRPGQRAAAQLAGADFPLHGERCPPPYRRLRITPPGAGRASVLSGWIAGLGRYLPACGPITVSPVVPPAYLP